MSAGLERTLHRDYYLTERVFALERERIFFREWVCVAREEELAEPGDYLVRDVAGESILLVRTRSGALAAHYNVCRHRGSQLVPDCERGRFAGGIRCPYHSWTYTLEGALRTAPFLEEGDGLTKSDLSLHPVGVDTWGGFVFVHLTPAELGEGRTLAAQLAGVPERLRRYPLAVLRVARRLEYPIAADVALISARAADRWGNLVYRETARNFGPVMASAAATTIVQVDEIVPLGSIDPETVVTPGLFVDRVVAVGRRAWLGDAGFIGGVDIEGRPLDAAATGTAGEGGMR